MNLIPEPDKFGHDSIFAATGSGWIIKRPVLFFTTGRNSRITLICITTYRNQKIHCTEKIAFTLKEQGLKDGIMHKAERNTPLTVWQRQKNCLISKTTK
jgi:hypothetical protein